MRNVRDPYLPLDHDAFVAADPPTGRVIVIAPTRAACATASYETAVVTLLTGGHEVSSSGNALTLTSTRGSVTLARQ